MGMFGALALLPLYLQIVKGSSPTQAGLQTLPLVLGIMSMSIFSGQFISRTGRYKLWPILGLSLMIVGIGLLSRVGVDTPYWRTALIMLVIGWGLGGNMQPLTLAVQNAMPPQDMGVATASATFFRQMGGTLGTAVFLSILFAALPSRIVDAFRAAATDPAFSAALRDPAVLSDPANQPVLAALSGGAAPNLDDSSFLRTVDPVLARPILEGFASSMSIVFLSAAAVLVIGLIAVTRMKEVPLRTQSGVEAVRSAESAAAGSNGTEPGDAEQGNAQVAAAAANAAPGAVVTPEASDVPPAPAARGPRPWRTAPVGGDGARTVIARGVDVAAPSGGGHGSTPDGSAPNGSTPNGSTLNGAVSNGSTSGNGFAGAGSGTVPGVGGLPAAPVLPAAPPVLTRAAASAGPTGDPGPEPPVADPRDRLLAMLLPDPTRALALIAEAEHARDAARRARRELADRSRDLDRAGEELVAQGLKPDQVSRLLGLTEQETPGGGRHRNAAASVGPFPD
jgi:hypothetical protein